ncbi:hypothetical protein [Spirosoma sp.]|uniref:hypothetical protein n=1 Tax=Spirosoma sp. TaxID=1899569 RepID=UPI003B3B1EDC
MKKIEHDSGNQQLNYHLKLPAQFASWNGFYDELIRLGLIQPATTIIRIKVFRAAHSVKEGNSLSTNLLYERQYIERMCLEEYRQERTTQPSHLLTIQEIEHLIDIVSNQASRLTDWDLLIKLKELLAYQQQQEKIRGSAHIESWQ